MIPWPTISGFEMCFDDDGDGVAMFIYNRIFLNHQVVWSTCVVVGPSLLDCCVVDNLRFSNSYFGFVHEIV